MKRARRLLHRPRDPRPTDALWLPTRSRCACRHVSWTTKMLSAETPVTTQSVVMQNAERILAEDDADDPEEDGDREDDLKRREERERPRPKVPPHVQRDRRDGDGESQRSATRMRTATPPPPRRPHRSTSSHRRRRRCPCCSHRGRRTRRAPPSVARRAKGPPPPPRPIGLRTRHGASVGVAGAAAENPFENHPSWPLAPSHESSARSSAVASAVFAHASAGATPPPPPLPPPPSRAPRPSKTIFRGAPRQAPRRTRR